MFMYMELCMLEGVGGLHCFIYIFTVTLSRTRTSLWLAAAAAAAVHQPIPLNVHTHTCSLKARRTDRPKRNRNQLRRCTIRIYNMRSFESLITTMFAYTYNLWVHLSSSMQSRSSETVCWVFAIQIYQSAGVDAETSDACVCRNVCAKRLRRVPRR